MTNKNIRWLCFVLVMCIKLSVASNYYECDTICQRWEGDKDSLNTICRRRYKLCIRQELDVGVSKRVSSIVPDAIDGFLTRPDVPCIDKSFIDIPNTMCRERCFAIKNETQIEMPLEACRADTYCCKLQKPVTRFPSRIHFDVHKFTKREPNDWTSVYKEMGWL